MSETTPSTTKPKRPAAPKKPGRAPQDRAAKEPTPSEDVDARAELEELEKELLGDMPSLRPAHRFRLSHRNRFRDLMLEAQKSGAFDRPSLDYDLTKPEDIEDYQKLAAFIESIDTWAESIADDPDAFAKWAEGKTEEHYMTIFRVYQAALGE